MRERFTKLSRFGMGMLCAAAAVACNRGDRDTAKAELDSAAGAVATAAESAAKAMGRAADTLAGRIAGREYTNGELTGLINAFNDTEIEMGTMAGTKATNAEVKAFARKIVADHKAMKTTVGTTSTQLGITPVVPTNDESLLKDHRGGIESLTAKVKGAEFDKAFLEHEIMMHKKVLDEIDDTIGRNRNTELKELLEKARGSVQGHLTLAEELNKKIV